MMSHSFGLKDGGFSGLQADLKWIAEDRKDVFPIGLELTPAGMIRWLGSRIILKKRQFVEKIRKLRAIQLPALAKSGRGKSNSNYNLAV